MVSRQAQAPTHWTLWTSVSRTGLTTLPLLFLEEFYSRLLPGCLQPITALEPWARVLATQNHLCMSVATLNLAYMTACECAEMRKPVVTSSIHWWFAVPLIIPYSLLVWVVHTSICMDLHGKFATFSLASIYHSFGKSARYSTHVADQDVTYKASLALDSRRGLTALCESLRVTRD